MRVASETAMTTIAERIATVSANLEYATAAREFASYCKFLIACRGDRIEARQLAEAANASPRVQNILKSAISTGSTSSYNALADYRTAVGGFLSTLKGYTVF